MSLALACSVQLHAQHVSSRHTPAGDKEKESAKNRAGGGGHDWVLRTEAAESMF